ncbi:TraX family protein [Agathobaculum sp. LCP25S3_E8]|uniref:TraX family protein n=1 Tax=Agathobaculum sp. LCP25S3_E8 TaxID=3438735 RepID=UPI003F8E3DB0
MHTLKINTYWLKVIALVAMTFSHIATIFFDIFPHYIVILCAMVGGITFPIMAFLLVQGANSTRNIQKYLLRMFVFWIISIIPFHVATSIRVMHNHSFFDLFNNVGCTLFFSLLMLHLLIKFDKVKSTAKWFIVSLFFGITLSSDWGGIGIIVIYCTYAFRNSKFKIYLAPCLISAEIILLGFIKYFFLGFRLVEPFYLMDSVLRGLGPLLAIPLLKSYDATSTRPSVLSKYLFYVYYPLHLLVIGIVAYITF